MIRTCEPVLLILSERVQNSTRAYPAHRRGGNQALGGLDASEAVEREVGEERTVARERSTETWTYVESARDLGTLFQTIQEQQIANSRF